MINFQMSMQVKNVRFSIVVSGVAPDGTEKLPRLQHTK
jgi:hypothetical protein